MPCRFDKEESWHTVKVQTSYPRFPSTIRCLSLLSCLVTGTTDREVLFWSARRPEAVLHCFKLLCPAPRTEPDRYSKFVVLFPSGYSAAKRDKQHAAVNELATDPWQTWLATFALGLRPHTLLHCRSAAPPCHSCPTQQECREFIKLEGERWQKLASRQEKARGSYQGSR